MILSTRGEPQLILHVLIAADKTNVTKTEKKNNEELTRSFSPLFAASMSTGKTQLKVIDN